MSTKFSEFIRRPFVVEAVQITLENIDELAQYIGAVQENEDGSLFIEVDSRLVPNIPRVYPGYFMTRMGDHVRCYSPRLFERQFTPVNEDIQKFLNEVGQQ